MPHNWQDNTSQRSVNRERPIIVSIVRFHSYNDRRVVWSARSALKNESISINKNFAAEVEYRRRLLYPILKAAKQSSRFERKAFINGDTPVLNNQSYNVEDLHKLPHDLHPSNMSKKENDQWLIFGGILSQYNCLSNFYKRKLSILRQPDLMIRHVQIMLFWLNPPRGQIARLKCKRM